MPLPGDIRIREQNSERLNFKNHQLWSGYEPDGRGGGLDVGYQEEEADWSGDESHGDILAGLFW